MLADSDLPALVEAFADPAIARIAMVPPPYGEAAARGFLAYRRRQLATSEAITFAVSTAVGDGRLVGTVVLRLYEDGRGELGYWMLERARRAGAATAAVRLVAGWALEEVGLPRLEILAEPENVASQRVAEGAGFQREGLLRAHRQIGGDKVDLIMYARMPAVDGSSRTRGGARPGSDPGRPRPRRADG